MPKPVPSSDPLGPSDTFIHRHIGPREEDIGEMLRTVGCASLDELVDSTIPEDIRLLKPLALGPPRGEHELLAELRETARKNKVFRSLIGMGYHDCITPPVIQRNVFENPGWYTQYTPYQAEISQGRLEALLNFQTMVADLTALPVANASLLDEATAAAEAMTMCQRIVGEERNVFFVDYDCHPQTIAVIQTRAKPLGIEIVVGGPFEFDFEKHPVFGLLVQYPTTDGRIVDYTDLIERAHAAGALAVMATDLLALTLIRPPGEFGADIAVGNSQRFGVPLGFGGPHAAFIATRDEHKRQLPGRLVGVSKDAHGNPAYRLAVQTREQHIRREKATSNICTAQVLLAIMAGMYAVYHGPEGLRRIAERIHALTVAMAEGMWALGYDEYFHGPTDDHEFFDTVRFLVARGKAGVVSDAFARHGINVRQFDDDGGESFAISLDEKSTVEEVQKIWEIMAEGSVDFTVDDMLGERSVKYDVGFTERFDRRTPYQPVAKVWHPPEADPRLRSSQQERGSQSPVQTFATCCYLTHPVFNSYHSETEMMRYLHRLQQRDLSLTTSMIPLGSCTMKLNAAVEMFPVSWPEFSAIHPFAPADQTQGYAELFERLEAQLAEISGLAATSLQPNAGAQGEYAGLLVIRAYHEHRGEGHRDVCLIPVSAHGTNPASAIMAGLRVVAIACNGHGNIDLEDLKAKAELHRDRLAALMVTYPSTHGVFERHIRDACEHIHEHGGQVYMDGANMNAQVGLCRPGDIGADVCHLNLHKTICIPHGGGGPGMGPICVAAHLAPFLPGHPLHNPQSAIRNQQSAIGPVSAAPYGSPSILPIPYVYIALMGAEGLTRASQVAILNANYMAKRLEAHYPILYCGAGGRVAHEFIIDCRQFEKSAGVKIDDIAKRLVDYGFHAPTMSWPVPGTLMIEPTESESKAELDRFCDALISIREEIQAIEQGRADRADNVLKGAPHTAIAIAADNWSHPYTREQAAFPAAHLRAHKFWPAVGRIDNAWGDRNLFCTCPPMDAAAGS